MFTDQFLSSKEIFLDLALKCTIFTENIKTKTFQIKERNSGKYIFILKNNAVLKMTTEFSTKITHSFEIIKVLLKDNFCSIQTAFFQTLLTNIEECS